MTDETTGAREMTLREYVTNTLPKEHLARREFEALDIFRALAALNEVAEPKDSSSEIVVQPQLTPLDQLEEALRETDMCVCGDRRDQHEGGSGPCLLDDGHSHGPWGHFGAGPCKKFTPAPPATAETDTLDNQETNDE